MGNHEQLCGDTAEFLFYITSIALTKILNASFYLFQDLKMGDD